MDRLPTPTCTSQEARKVNIIQRWLLNRWINTDTRELATTPDTFLPPRSARQWKMLSLCNVQYKRTRKVRKFSTERNNYNRSRRQITYSVVSKRLQKINSFMSLLSELDLGSSKRKTDKREKLNESKNALAHSLPHPTACSLACVKKRRTTRQDKNNNLHFLSMGDVEKIIPVAQCTSAAQRNAVHKILRIETAETENLI